MPIFPRMLVQFAGKGEGGGGMRRCPAPWTWLPSHLCDAHSHSSLPLCSASPIMKVGILLFVVASVAGHASLIMPPTRNAIDSTLPAWSNGKHPMTGWIEPYNCACTNGTEAACESGQSCFWFSQGVSVGCKKADGNGTRIPNLDHCPEERAPGFDPLKMDGALLPKYRTVNLNATPGSIADIWK